MLSPGFLLLHVRQGMIIALTHQIEPTFSFIR